MDRLSKNGCNMTNFDLPTQHFSTNGVYVCTYHFLQLLVNLGISVNTQNICININTKQSHTDLLDVFNQF